MSVFLLLCNVAVIIAGAIKGYGKAGLVSGDEKLVS